MENEKIVQSRIDQDNPEWTKDDFENARPAVDVVPDIVEAYEEGTLKIREGELRNK